jgi:hypothetical protein
MKPSNNPSLRWEVVAMSGRRYAAEYPNSDV